MKNGKKYVESAKLIDKTKLYDANEALDIVCQTAKAKFDETVEIHIRLGVDSRHADQQVRGAIVLPNGTGKTVRTLVFAKGDKATAAAEAGADYVGAEEYVTKIQGGWFDFDVVIASPDMMGVIGRLGKARSCQCSISIINLTSCNLSYTTLIREKLLQARKRNVEAWSVVLFGISTMLKIDYETIIMEFHAFG